MNYGDESQEMMSEGKCYGIMNVSYWRIRAMEQIEYVCTKHVGDGMDGKYTRGRDEKCTYKFTRKSEGVRRVWCPCVNGRILLKYSLQKYNILTYSGLT
jgi:hypothetical protein